MMGMAQRRPPMGPSPYTAGMPNPMAGLPQRPPGGGFPPMQGPPQVGGGRFPPMQGPPNFGGGGYQPNPPMGPWGPIQPQFGGGNVMPDPYQQNTPGAMWGGQFVPAGQTPPGGAGAYDRDGNLLGGGQQGMSDAMMHPFAPRNRPQFPGAAQGGIMGGMGVGPQMTPPWMRRQYQGL